MQSLFPLKPSPLTESPHYLPFIYVLVSSSYFILYSNPIVYSIEGSIVVVVKILYYLVLFHVYFNTGIPANTDYSRSVVLA